MTPTMVYMRIFILSLLLSVFCISCEAKAKNEKGQDMPPSPEFPAPPAEYRDPELRASYILKNVFAPYEALDTSIFLTDAVAEQFWVNYFAIAQVATKGSLRGSITEAFSKGTQAFDKQIIEFVDEYLYQVNSPIHNEGMYIQVLQIADSMSILSEGEKVILEDRYNMYMKNQVGSTATDFSYTTPKGETLSLHRTSGEVILVVFYNPRCDVCRGVMGHINASKIINHAVDKGMTVLCVSLTDNEHEWNSHLNEVPTRAIVGINSNREVINNSLYNIKAYPTLYLLDKDKKVIAKDPMIQQVEQILQKMEL